MGDFSGRNVLIGVTGGIAAYKVVELARLLVRGGASVKVVMTRSAQGFITPLTFRTVTGNPVSTSLFGDPGTPLPHISLSEEADLIVVAPATANIIAKYARGVADDLLSTTLLAARGTVVIAPAMNTRMWLHPVVQENLEALRRRGVVIVEPGEGDLACGEEGAGRMAEPAEILAAVETELGRYSDLQGARLLVTAGPTREHIDPVRFLSNPSTGMMGFAVAGRAARRGANVILVAGPTCLPCPAGVKLIPVVTAREMKERVFENLQGVDALVMAAAVADFRPRSVAPEKIKKSAGVPSIELEPTEDILKEVSSTGVDVIRVGFAAETENVIENARRKLTEKRLDLVLANKVAAEDSGFAVSTCLAAILSSADEDAELSMMPKTALAELLLDRIAALIKKRR